MFRQAPVLAQKFIEHHAARGGYVERMLAPQHRDSHVCVAQFEQSRTESLHFVSEQNAHWKSGLPIEQIDGMDTGFHCSDFVVAGAQTPDQVTSVRVMFPSDGLFGAECRLRDRALRRT